jgi:hypothetical protein
VDELEIEKNGDLELAVRESPLYTLAKFEVRCPDSSRRDFAILRQLAPSPAVVLPERDILEFCEDENGSVETIDPSISQEPDPIVF